MPQSGVEESTSVSWHHLAEADVVARLGADPSAGLTPDEVEARQNRFGPNEVAAKSGKSPLMRFLLEFNQPLIYVLLVAGTVALLLRDWVDAGVIFGVTLINAVIGFIQESKAENAIAALARTVVTEATVLRAGEKARIPSRELVPGDLVLLSSGDKAPADIRLLSARDLQINESALTGESTPVEKNPEPLPEDTSLADRANMVYASSLVTFGQGKGLVVAIANDTETGRISQLIEKSTGLETPLTRKIQGFSRTLLYIILGMAALSFLVSLLTGLAWGEGFKAAVALVVAAIPEGLPAVVTVTLAIGVGRMAQRHAIIRKLPAVEALGSTTVICSDKTGTLTENEMTVQGIYAGGQFYQVTGVGYDAEGDLTLDGKPMDAPEAGAIRESLVAGLLCNDSHLQEQDGEVSVAGDPTEGALIVAAQKAGLKRQDLENAFPRLDTIPFESQFQYMATLHSRKKDDSQGNVMYVKGSVDVLLPRCDNMLDADGKTVPANTEEITRNVETMAAQGLRVLAFAFKDLPAETTDIRHEDTEADLIFIGLQGMIDPPRQEAISAVAACRTAGIQVKMITGDHALTAKAIAKQLRLSEDEDISVFTGRDLAAMSSDDFIAAAESGAVFARVEPEQKLRLVEALQSQGEIVAMTGDGVNDAPALKQADIGVAMGITGTEVAKEAADMVLADDNFASIEAAVEEGRTVYHNLLKAIGYILPVNGGESMTILAGMLFASTLPILPVQVLWVNMVSSVALTAPLAFEPKSPHVMQQPPRSPNEPLLSRNLLVRIIIISIYNLIAVFGVFEWAMQTVGDIGLARTMAVQTLVAAEMFYLFSVSRVVPTLLSYLRDRTAAVAYVPLIGITVVLIIQFLFSQLGIMNTLFHTLPLTGSQAVICLAAGFPVLVPGLLLKRFASLNWG